MAFDTSTGGATGPVSGGPLAQTGLGATMDRIQNYDTRGLADKKMKRYADLGQEERLVYDDWLKSDKPVRMSGDKLVAQRFGELPHDFDVIDGQAVDPDGPDGEPGTGDEPNTTDPSKPGYVGPGAPGAPGEAGYEQPGAENLSDIAARLLNISSEDVDYLRGEPYSTTQEQAMRAREQARIRNEYDTARQRMIDTLGAEQGMSGVMAGVLRRLSSDEAKEMAGVDRDVFIKAADEMRSRRTESRGVVGGLEQLERQRMMESLGIEQGLDADERQRLTDLMALMGLTPALRQGADPAMLQYAQSLGQMGQQQAAGVTQSIGSLADILSKAGILK